MASEIGKSFARLIKDLETNAPGYNVFYAIYLAEILSKEIHPDRDISKLDQKGLEFRPYEYYVFPSKDICSFDCKDGIMTFVLSFLGLYGVDSPLPRCYHEEVAVQQSIQGPGNVPIQNFLDIFNTRFYWLYYQAWKKYRYYLQLGHDPNNRTVQRVFSFAGPVDQ
ncbi:MAG: type VI secretion system baseplate subunit TssG, partial [Candidatus Hodarchaeota archaeon]